MGELLFTIRRESLEDSCEDPREIGLDLTKAFVAYDDKRKAYNCFVDDPRVDYKK